MKTSCEIIAMMVIVDEKGGLILKRISLSTITFVFIEIFNFHRFIF